MLNSFYNPVIRREFNRLPTWTSLLFNDEEQKTYWPSIDVKETKDKFVFDLDAPGLEEKDFKVEFYDGILNIEASKNETKEETKEDEHYHLKERTHRSFKRSFSLGEKVEAENIAATYKNGILRIEIPKSEKASPKAIPVKVA